MATNSSKIFATFAAILLIAGVFVFLIPQTQAVDFTRGLIPCGTRANPTPCNPCHIFTLAQNILNFLWTFIAIPLATLMLAYGGVLMVVAGIGGGSPASIDKGKKVLTNAVIGIVVIFFAWLGVDTIIKLVGGQDIRQGTVAKIFGPWNQVKCEIKTPVAPVNSPVSNSPASNTASASAFEQQKQINPNFVNLSVPFGAQACEGSAQGRVCKIDSELNNRLKALNSKIQDEGKFGFWQVTEAWPPTGFSPSSPNGIHQDTCHGNGTCVDANLLGSARQNPKDIAYYAQKASQVGLRVEYETQTQTRADELIKAGIPKENIRVVQRITGEHFSVYMK